MDDDDLTPWNPAHFGHTDFQKESDGQLTIFFEDAHEPPDPDDFASIADYEIAWTEWEQTQILPQSTQQEDKIMFNFTAPIDNEIAQLHAKLAELEAQKQLLVSRESCANKILIQVEECVVKMREAGVDKNHLKKWAIVIFEKITGEGIDNLAQAVLEQTKTDLGIVSIDENNVLHWVKENEKLINQRNEALQKYTDSTEASLRVSEELKAARKEISQLKSVNLQTTAMLETAVSQRDHYQEECEKLRNAAPGQEGFRIDLLKQVSDLKIERDTALERLAELEKISAANVQGITQLSQANQELCDKLNKLRGESKFKEVFEEIGKGEKVEENPRQNPGYLESANNQNIAAEFMRKLIKKARVDSLTWEKLKKLPINADVLREIGLAASSRSKTHQYLLEKMPQICAAYINESGDKSDLEWLPESFKNKVEGLLEQVDSISSDEEAEEESKKSISPPEDDAWDVLEKIKTDANKLNRGEMVRMVNPESPYLNQEWTVLDCNGEWVNVQDADGLTDMWQVSDVELVVNAAA